MSRKGEPSFEVTSIEYTEQVFVTRVSVGSEKKRFFF